MDIFDFDTYPKFGLLVTGLATSKQWFTDIDRQRWKRVKRYMNDSYWKYSNVNIEYDINRDGYRNDKDFDDFDWSNTTALVGCSYVFGQGIENENTISEILTREYGEPTANLGFPGGSNAVIHHNAIAVAKKYRPKKIIILWSYPTRHSWIFDNDNRWFASSIGPWSNRKELNRYLPHMLPAEFFAEYSPNTIFNWQQAHHIHELLGNKQYNVIDGKNRFFDPTHWIEPKDTTLYDLKDKHEMLDRSIPHPDAFSISVSDLQTPKYYEMINKLYASDLHYYPETGKIVLGHFGEMINRDIADLIYRENFT